MENIKELKYIETERHKKRNGYIDNRESIELYVWNTYNNICLINGLESTSFSQHIWRAIFDMQAQIIERAYELEEEEYQRVKLKAKQEAANLIAGENIIDP